MAIGALGSNAGLARTNPPGEIEIERTFAKTSLGILGGAAGLTALYLVGGALLSRAGAGALASRLNARPFILGGVAAAVAGASAYGALAMPNRHEHALATGFLSKGLAQAAEGDIDGYTKVVHAADGTWAVLRDDPPRYSGGGGGGSSGEHYHYDHRPSYSPPSHNTSPSDHSSGGSSGGSGGSSSSRNSTSNGNPGFE